MCVWVSNLLKKNYRTSIFNCFVISKKIAAAMEMVDKIFNSFNSLLTRSTKKHTKEILQEILHKNDFKIISFNNVFCHLYNICINYYK